MSDLTELDITMKLVPAAEQETAAEREAAPERKAPEREAAPETESPPETDVLVSEEEEERIATPWRVILYNDEIHTFEEVIVQLVKATGCTEQQAEKWAWQVHTNGKACVFEGEFEECFRVQGVLKEIGLVTEVEG